MRGKKDHGRTCKCPKLGLGYSRPDLLRGRYRPAAVAAGNTLKAFKQSQDSMSVEAWKALFVGGALSAIFLGGGICSIIKFGGAAVGQFGF